jgi:hypothetical protein
MRGDGWEPGETVSFTGFTPGFIGVTGCCGPEKETAASTRIVENEIAVFMDTFFSLFKDIYYYIILKY